MLLLVYYKDNIELVLVARVALSFGVYPGVVLTMSISYSVYREGSTCSGPVGRTHRVRMIVFRCYQGRPYVQNGYICIVESEYHLFTAANLQKFHSVSSRVNYGYWMFVPLYMIVAHCELRSHI